MKTTRSGYVCLVGAPNAGKSTLLNQLLGMKLAIVSPRPQSTRRRVAGILNHRNMQMILLDTPGIVAAKYALHKQMMETLNNAIRDSDIILAMVDASQAKLTELDAIRESGKPVLMALNKIDISSKASLLPKTAALHEQYLPRAIVPISARTGEGIDNLLSELEVLLPAGPAYYPIEQISDQPERFFVAELIREQVFFLFRDEIPYAVEVQVEEFQERVKGKDHIYAIIYVERESQKRILIGKQGSGIHALGKAARLHIEAFLDRPVYLELQVKVLAQWRRDTAKLNRLGFGQ
jgi:GTP-binding protein Era